MDSRMNSRRPCMIFFNQTLLEKFQAPPMTLLETRERINRTLLEIFQADLAQKFLSRPWLQKVKQICRNQKSRKCLHVAGNSGKTTRPCMKIFKQTLLEVRLSRPCVKFFNRTLLEKFQAPPMTLLETRERINRTLLEIF